MVADEAQADDTLAVCHGQGLRTARLPSPHRHEQRYDQEYVQGDDHDSIHSIAVH